MSRVSAAECLVSVFMARMIFTSGGGHPYRYQEIPLMLQRAARNIKHAGRNARISGCKIALTAAPARTFLRHDELPDTSAWLLSQTSGTVEFSTSATDVDRPVWFWRLQSKPTI
jgi:hypothetical protein